ncbi:MAG: hypothetical protein M9887_08665 [Chitinophagales bacterium]|nr:hypothetical protein [Chitinophagales bacterium]
MKTACIFIWTLLFVSACTMDNSNAQNAGADSQQKTNATNTNTLQDDKSSKNYWKELVNYEIKDKNGELVASTPIPASWKVDAKNGVLTGPGDLKIIDYKAKSFFSANGQNGLNPYTQTPQRSFPGIEQLIQQDIVPFFRQQNLTYVGYEELPKVAKPNEWYAEQLYRVGPKASVEKSYGLDFKKPNGDPAFVLINLTVGQINDMQNWYYTYSLLQSDKSVFEKSKKQYLFALENIHYNMEPIIAYNEAEARRIGQSWDAFRQKMNDNQRAFESWQRNQINKNEAINNAIMSNYKSNNERMDREQDRFLDYIYERQNVQSDETGQKYKVEYGYNRYWMNNDGDYLAVPYQDYDPNADKNLNQVHWQELNKIK